MRFKEFDLVRLVTDHSADEGVVIGSEGIVLDVFADGYIVEFSRPDGTTISWFSVGEDEIRAVEGPESMVLRRAS